MTFNPLHNINILDLTSVVVGPVSTWRLGQYGANIIKVESPNGDLMRQLGGVSRTGQHSGTYLHLNRGKRNVCLDLKNNKTQPVIERLIDWADVIVANMRPQALKRLGLDAETIRNKSPKKIYCLLTGYGTNGPYAGLPTYDSVVQGVSGIAGLALERDGEPAYVPLLVCDHVVGEIAAGAIMAALLQKKETGEGASIEVPMFETMAGFVLQEHMAAQSFDPPLGQAGDRRLLSPYNKPVKTKNGYISFTINTNAQVHAFLLVTGRASLTNDPRFSSLAARSENVEEWFEIRGASLPDKTTDEWIEIFREADLAAMPCHSLETLLEDPHLKAVDLVAFENHPTEGRVASIRSSVRVNGFNIDLRNPSEPLGWNTREILSELNFSNDLVEDLISNDAAFICKTNEKE